MHHCSDPSSPMLLPPLLQSKRETVAAKVLSSLSCSSTVESSAGADVSVKGYIFFSPMIGTIVPAAAHGQSLVYLVLKHTFFMLQICFL